MSTMMENAQVVSLTPNAVRQVKELITTKNMGNVALRISVQKGGCSGLSYQLNFDTEAQSGDLLSEVDGLRVLVDQESSVHLSGMALDFSNDLVGGGFKFSNPNAKQSCGCGESFST